MEPTVAEYRCYFGVKVHHTLPSYSTLPPTPAFGRFFLIWFLQLLFFRPFVVTVLFPISILFSFLLVFLSSFTARDLEKTIIALNVNAPPIPRTRVRHFSSLPSSRIYLSLSCCRGLKFGSTRSRPAGDDCCARNTVGPL